MGSTHVFIRISSRYARNFRIFKTFRRDNKLLPFYRGCGLIQSVFAVGKRHHPSVLAAVFDA